VIDPSYISAPAMVLRHAVTVATGYVVACENALLMRHPLEIDHDNRVIRIQRGLGLDNFGHLMWCALARLIGGKAYAPDMLEFPGEPKLRLIEGSAPRTRSIREIAHEVGPATAPLRHCQ
jgi:hypothetical protein